MEHLPTHRAENKISNRSSDDGNHWNDDHTAKKPITDKRQHKLVDAADAGALFLKFCEYCVVTVPERCAGSEPDAER